MVAVARLPRPVSLREKLLTVGLGLGGRGVLGLVLGRSAVSAAGFVGAYDAVPSIVAAYGMRRLLASYTGSLLRLRRSSDSAESDFGYDANGDLDAAAIASFIGAGSGYVRTWYDQSGGSKNAAQTTPANQPIYVASGQNSKPVVSLDGTNDWLGCDVIISTAAYSGLGVVKSSVTKTWLGLSASGTQFMSGYHINTGNNRHNHKNGSAEVAGGTFDTPASNGAYHVRVIDHASTAYGQSIDASYVTTTASVTAFDTAWLTVGGYRLAAAVIALPFAGEIAELVVANAGWSTGERQAAEAAANAYWSIY